MDQTGCSGFFAVFVILTIALLSGHGSKFISGYNTASKKRKPDMMRKLCRVYRIGMGVIAILLLITGLFESFCHQFVYVLLVLIVIDVVIIIIPVTNLKR
ncbi:MAG: DUF3784 domain-containing protein [Blautia faecis]